MNRWGIPPWLEAEIRQRDQRCVYCGVMMSNSSASANSRKVRATWEHIINDARIITRENIALCCAACNSSKGTKSLVSWINSEYCKIKGINEEKVSDVVRAALRAARKQKAQPAH
jgi:hypothetical protein